MLKLLTFSIFISFALSASIDPQDTWQQRSVEIPSIPFNPNATESGDADDSYDDENNRGGRISGGKAAVDGQFPFVNEINTYKSGTNQYSLCTGAFLTTSWTITALHCLLADTPEWDPIFIIYGAASRTSTRRMTVGVNSMTYWTSDARIDVALLRHERPITLSTNVGLIQLPPLSMENSYYNGYTATQAGYGAFKNLQFHELVLNSNAAGCFSNFERNGICSTSKTGTSTAEGGDSGSPLFINENGKRTLVGVHWGRSGGFHRATRVSRMIRSISSIVGLPLRA